jgi:hypothetical protein
MIFDGTCERGGAQRAPQGIGVRRLGAYGAIATATTRRGEGEGGPCSMRYAGVCLSVILVTSDTSAAAMARKYERRFVVCGLCFLSFVFCANRICIGIRHPASASAGGRRGLEFGGFGVGLGLFRAAGSGGQPHPRAVAPPPCLFVCFRGPL